MLNNNRCLAIHVICRALLGQWLFSKCFVPAVLAKVTKVFIHNVSCLWNEEERASCQSTGRSQVADSPKNLPALCWQLTVEISWILPHYSKLSVVDLYNNPPSTSPRLSPPNSVLPHSCYCTRWPETYAPWPVAHSALQSGRLSQTWSPVLENTFQIFCLSGFSQAERKLTVVD